MAVTSRTGKYKASRDYPSVPVVFRGRRGRRKALRCYKAINLLCWLLPRYVWLLTLCFPVIWGKFCRHGYFVQMDMLYKVGRFGKSKAQQVLFLPDAGQERKEWNHRTIWQSDCRQAVKGLKTPVLIYFSVRRRAERREITTLIISERGRRVHKGALASLPDGESAQGQYYWFGRSGTARW